MKEAGILTITERDIEAVLQEDHHQEEEDQIIIVDLLKDIILAEEEKEVIKRVSRHGKSTGEYILYKVYTKAIYLLVGSFFLIPIIWKN